MIGGGGEIVGAETGTWPNVRAQAVITGIVPFGTQVAVDAVEINCGTAADWKVRAFAICARIAG